MKYLVLVPDGMADYPLPELGGQTPLAHAETPHMDRLAAASEVGLAATVPPHLDPGSDVANLSIFGYDPAQYYTGRGPLEAVNMGIDLAGGVAYRCNLVCIEDGCMADFTSGHITTPESRAIMETLDAALGRNGFRFHPGVQYRHILRTDGSLAEAACTPPHDIPNQPVADCLPRGPAAVALRTLMDQARPILAEHQVNAARRARGERTATDIWPWGQGKTPAMPSFRQAYGKSGAVISAVDLINGIGRAVGFEVIQVPGATGFLDTNYEGKADGALDALTRHDLVYVHVEAPDECGHMGDPHNKAQAIRDFDQRLLGRLLDGLSRCARWRLLLLPDHPTPCPVRTHVREPILYLLHDSGVPRTGTVSQFTEAAVAAVAGEPVAGHGLMHRLLAE